MLLISLSTAQHNQMCSLVRSVVQTITQPHVTTCTFHKCLWTKAGAHEPLKDDEGACNSRVGVVAIEIQIRCTHIFHIWKVNVYLGVK